MSPYPQCRFGDGEAIALFHMVDGCMCFPDEREQDLCLHHAYRATPLGRMVMIRDYSQGQQFSRVWQSRYGDGAVQLA